MVLSSAISALEWRACNLSEVLVTHCELGAADRERKGGANKTAATSAAQHQSHFHDLSIRFLAAADANDFPPTPVCIRFGAWLVAFAWAAVEVPRSWAESCFHPDSQISM